MPDYDVFLSHNRRQKPWVRDFYRILRDRNLSVFFDEEIEAGADYVREVSEAIKSSRKVVFVISESSVRSAWVHREIDSAIHWDPAASKKKILPVLLEPVAEESIPAGLEILERMDLTNHPRQFQEWEKLLRALGLPSGSIPPMPHWERTLSVAGKRDVEVWNWTKEKLLEALIGLDFEVIDGLTPVDEGTINQWGPVFWEHPHTWRLLLDDPESIVGYWHYVPLRAPDFAQAKQGQLVDSDIILPKVSQLALAQCHDIYFVSICLKKGFGENVAWTRQLFESFLEVATELARQGYFFKEVCANAYTPIGESICEGLEMEPKANHKNHGKIYARNFYPFPESILFKKYEELRRSYAQQFR